MTIIIFWPSTWRVHPTSIYCTAEIHGTLWHNYKTVLDDWFQMMSKHPLQILNEKWEGLYAHVCVWRCRVIPQVAYLGVWAGNTVSFLKMCAWQIWLSALPYHPPIIRQHKSVWFTKWSSFTMCGTHVWDLISFCFFCLWFIRVVSDPWVLWL